MKAKNYSYRTAEENTNTFGWLFVCIVLLTLAPFDSRLVLLAQGFAIGLSVRLLARWMWVRYEITEEGMGYVQQRCYGLYGQFHFTSWSQVALVYSSPEHSRVIAAGYKLDIPGTLPGYSDLVVEIIQHAASVNDSAPPFTVEGLDPQTISDVISLLHGGLKIQSVKLVRDRTNLKLKDALAAVNHIESQVA